MSIMIIIRKSIKYNADAWQYTFRSRRRRPKSLSTTCNLHLAVHSLYVIFTIQVTFRIRTYNTRFLKIWGFFSGGWLKFFGFLPKKALKSGLLRQKSGGLFKSGCSGGLIKSGDNLGLRQVLYTFKSKCIFKHIFKILVYFKTQYIEIWCIF